METPVTVCPTCGSENRNWAYQRNNWQCVDAWHSIPVEAPPDLVRTFSPISGYSWKERPAVERKEENGAKNEDASNSVVSGERDVLGSDGLRTHTGSEYVARSGRVQLSSETGAVSAPGEAMTELREKSFMAGNIASRRVVLLEDAEAYAAHVMVALTRERDALKR